jgi:ketosteroid isomerase-like protein
MDPTTLATRFLGLLGDGDIDAWLALLHDDIVIDTPFAPAGEPTTFAGRDEIERRFGNARRRMQALAFLDVEVDDTTTPGRVLVTCRSEGTMGDGSSYANRYCWIIDTDGEHITRVTEYFDPQPVLAVRAAPTAAAQGSGATDPAVARLLDERAIERLMADYCDRIDANDPAGAASCFANDGIGHYWGEFRGPSAIAERLVEILDEFTATSHHLSNIRIEFGDDPDRATAQSYVYAFHRRRADASSFHYWGRWVDELVRTRHGWRFHRREVVGIGGYEPGDRRRNRTFPGHPERIDRPPRMT